MSSHYLIVVVNNDDAALYTLYNPKVYKYSGSPEGLYWIVDEIDGNDHDVVVVLHLQETNIAIERIIRRAHKRAIEYYIFDTSKNLAEVKSG